MSGVRGPSRAIPRSAVSVSGFSEGLGRGPKAVLAVFFRFFLFFQPFQQYYPDQIRQRAVLFHSDFFKFLLGFLR